MIYQSSFQKTNNEDSDKVVNGKKDSSENDYEKKVIEQKKRIMLLIEARNLDSSAAFIWAQEQIWNESVGFIKNQIRKYGDFGQKNYHLMMNEAAIDLYKNIDDYDSEKGTLTTFLTPILKHCFSSVFNREIFKSSDYFSSNMMKVERAKKYFTDYDIPDPTISDIANYTNLSIAKVEDALVRINAKNMISIDSDDFISPTAETGNPEAEAILADRKDSLVSALNKLSKQDYDILVTKFDLFDHYGKSLSDSQVAKIFHLRPDEVRKSIRRSLQILHADRKLSSIYNSDFKRPVTPLPPSRRTIAAEKFFDDDNFDDLGENLSDYNSNADNKESGSSDDKIQWN